MLDGQKLKPSKKAEKARCEGYCKQLFNWWDLMWDMKEDRMVCVNCFYRRK